PLTMNAVAERILASGDSGLGVIGGRVAARESTLGHTLRALIAAACREDGGRLAGGGELLVRSEASGAPQLSLTVIPIGGNPIVSVHRAAVILIQNLAAVLDPALEQRLRYLFGLTPKEAQLAVALASGLSVKDYAQEQGVSLVTARTHLAKLFSKTATVRQGQLVALLNRAARIPPGGAHAI
ncbi:MAG: helix-turn-helix transcriptional regulator, partial [Alphaproteobacteria bacterium]